MFSKGKNFLAAAILLRQNGGYEYVVLHLLCQGIEIVLKALLLFKEFDKHRAMLSSKDGGYGHNLVRLSGDVLSTFGLSPARSPLATELQRVNSFYSQHLLRYGSFLDIFVDPNTIQSDLIVWRILAGVRLVERELAHAPGP
jgi:hypothetical protein